MGRLGFEHHWWASHQWHPTQTVSENPAAASP